MIEKKAVRDSNLEMLRIIAIFMIMMHHACISRGLEIFKTPFVMNHIAVSALGIWGMFGVDIFFLISFWFMLEKNFTYRIERWIKLIAETILLALIAFGISIVVFKDPLSFSSLAKTILSPALNTYWYITAYLMVFLLLPFFRVLNGHISNAALLTLLGIAFVTIPLYRGGLRVSPYR